MNKKVKNYAEYRKLLKIVFDGFEKMPEQREIQVFIDAYSLYDDWGIVISEVAQDIMMHILKPDKQISSYKTYLDKLHDVFGIPETMPDLSRISEFIEEHDLFLQWGITEEDVSKDLQSFIDGKYDEMSKNTAPVYKPVSHVESKTHPITPVTYHITYSIPSYTYIPETNLYRSSATKQEIPKRDGKPKSRKSAGKKSAVKSKAKPEKHKTIFLDGDNHIKEGQQGIEQLSKNTDLKAVFSQPGAQRKFDKKYGTRPNVSSELVKSGKQAVDNQIKTEAGQLLKKGNQHVIFVSHDKDFAEYRDRKRNKNDGNRITVTKSVKNLKPKK